MEHIATKKITGGKLLRVKLDIDENGLLSSVSLTGDFFVHPEDGVTEMEKALVGMSSDATVGEFVSKLNDVVHGVGLELIGFSVSDVADMIFQAVLGLAGDANVTGSDNAQWVDETKTDEDDVTEDGENA